MMTYLDKDILPLLGDKSLTDITRADCARVQARIEARNAHNVAKKVRCWLREIFSQSIARGLCENNVASELRVIAAPAPASKPYPHLLEPELPDFLNALDRSTSRLTARVAAWMTIWTASRPGMVRFAEWSEVDFDKALWSIPASKMKMRRDYVAPLPTQLIDALHELHQLTGRHRHLFPGIGAKNETISENTINLVFRKIGYKGQMVGHGARHTASTLLREHGWFKDHVETKATETTNAAPHIVPKKAGGAVGDSLRACIARSGVEIDMAGNDICLPTKDPAPTAALEHDEQGMHLHRYFQALLDRCRSGTFHGDE